MSDRELLELAARAAGHCMDYIRWDGYRFVEQKVHGVPHCGLNYEKTWNPLADDGDALRLAVEVGLVVCVMRNAGFTGIYLPACRIGGKYDEVQVHGTDHLAATRRAIVRASASVGEAMQ